MAGVAIGSMAACFLAADVMVSIATPSMIGMPTSMEASGDPLRSRAGTADCAALLPVEGGISEGQCGPVGVLKDADLPVRADLAGRKGAHFPRPRCARADAPVPLVG